VRRGKLLQPSGANRSESSMFEHLRSDLPHQLVLRLVSDPTLAEDLISEVFLDEVRIPVANRVGDEAEFAAVREKFPEREVFGVPYDPAITRADVDGRAPIDAAPGSPGVRAILGLADALMRRS
jgi:hypothetical protein